MQHGLRYGLIIALVSTVSACSLGTQHGTYDPLFWDSGLSDMEARFELAKRSEPELIAFLRRMPKGSDLHNHLSGATYSDYLLDSAKANGLNYNLANDRFTDEKVDGQVIAFDTLVSNSTYYAHFLDTYSMRGWYSNTTNGHDHFFNTFNYMSSARRSGAEQLAEVIRRNLYQNIEYAEFMTSTAPQELSDALDKAMASFDSDDFGLEQLEACFTATETVRKDPHWSKAIRDYIGKRQDDSYALLDEATRQRVTGKNPELIIRYIPQLYRTVPLKRFFRDAVAAMMSVEADPRIVAVNMVQAEDDPHSRWQFDAQMKILDFLWTRMGKPNIALHAGELVLQGSPVEPMWNRIRDSIEIGHAKRIGHGVAIAWSRDVVGLLEEMRRRHVLVEICLSSNESILGVAGKAHPFMLYRRAGVPVSLNTDDEGVSRSTLTEEFVKAVERYPLSYRDLKDLARNSIEYAFLPGTGLYENHDYTRLRPEFLDVRNPEWQSTSLQKELLAADPKLEREVRLERAFIDFERNLAQGFREPAN
ncbi:amidohydrolase family protein [Desulfogranum japonicum]|uniref:hypothetical protein n=1 Tax=Desulfogranum japonicum TaxID=231447 RepID=UPI001378B7F2|nr:hypothetical protein [Desulfogranum japonicum]